MVKPLKIKNIENETRKHRLVVALFYSKKCAVCKWQETEMNKVAKKLKDNDVSFVKIEVTKKDSQSKFGISSVPVIMMWLRGQQVAFQWEPGGAQSAKINGKIAGEMLEKKITYLLDTY